MEMLFGSRGGKVFIVSPFITCDVFEQGRLGGWRSLCHGRFSLTIVTRGEQTAESLSGVLGQWPWQRLTVRCARHLHGKIYLLRECSGTFAGMLGSHNLTHGGLRDNLELGVFFRGTPGSSLQDIFDRCEREIRKL